MKNRSLSAPNQITLSKPANPLPRYFAALSKSALTSVSATATAIPSEILIALQVALGTSTEILMDVTASADLEKRLKLLVEQVNDRFSTIRDELVEDEHFASHWKIAIRATLDAAREEKVALIANALASFATDSSKPYTTKSAMLRDLDVLELEHFQLLKLAYDSFEDELAKKKADSTYELQYLRIEDAIVKLGHKFPDVWKLANDLLSRGLVVDPKVGTWDYWGFQRMRITQYGIDFIKFVLLHPDVKIDSTAPAVEAQKA